MNIKRLLKFIWDNTLSEKSWINDNEFIPPYYVVAGDPVNASVPSLNEYEMPHTLKTFAGQNRGFIVAGNSMAPKGILNGDALACKAANQNNNQDLRYGSLLIIRVDKDYYTHDNRIAKFDFKLRFAVCGVPVGTDFDTLYSQASQLEDSLLLPDNKKELQRKFVKASQYYTTNEPLVLSLTYHKDCIGYSFHPAKLVEFIVDYIGKPDNAGGWRKSEAEFESRPA